MDDFSDKRIVKDVFSLKDYIDCINGIIEEKDKSSVKYYNKSQYNNLNDMLERLSSFDNCVDNYDIYLTATLRDLVERTLNDLACFNNNITKNLITYNTKIKFFYRGHYSKK